MTLLEPEARALDYCTYCPKLCRHACPVSNVVPREALIPQRKVETANLLRKGHLPWNTESTEVLYGCTGCGACTNACAWGNEPGRLLTIARTEAENHHAGHPALVDLLARFQARETRLRASASDLLPPARKDALAAVALHTGCESLDGGADDARAALRLFDRLGVAVGCTETHRICGGYPLYAAGQLEAFRTHARRFATQLGDHAQVASTCPACVWLVREVYPRHGIRVRPEVSHVVELAQTFADALPPSPAERPPVLYHDPCFLGRHRDVYEAPRALLGRVADVREFSRNRGEAECSGGGGLVPQTMPEAAQGMAARRLIEARQAGIRRVVTACPTCLRQFQGVSDGLEIVDLVTTVAESLG